MRYFFAPGTGPCPVLPYQGLRSLKYLGAGLLLLVLPPIAPAQAQLNFKVGLRGGGSFANAAGPDAAKRKVRLAYHGGITTQLLLGKYWSVGPEVLYSVKGDNTLQYGPSIGAELSYLEAPLLVRYTRDDAFIEVGPYAAYLLRTRQNDTLMTVALGTAPTYEKLDYGAVLGIGYQDPGGFSLSWRYVAGLADVYPKGFVNPGERVRLRNSVVQFTLGYRFNDFSGLKKIRLNPFKRRAKRNTDATS